VTNVFQLNYDSRLRSWYDLRQTLQNADNATKCLEIDNWWQNAPLVNHHLHILDVNCWPSPWELLVENTYCTVARGLGMCYTLLLMNITNIDKKHSVRYKEDNFHILVLYSFVKNRSGI
jgi:hypothetical protein